ncbi:hypothetical protein HG536_0A06720 [Torulaspora globosa]|uniref:Dynamin-type G domain-containing protein n=1 Tax=Torulaspora globosa TaxID=48254 RepID=A0A7G3ZBH1_9SACH|nr:uncharacterized protein HG536_0A06720 [Torulaspora globosa]QLL30857.1 hypothetical protein HG536_0A06720 [Torulaspora globosa]
MSQKHFNTNGNSHNVKDSPGRRKEDDEKTVVPGRVAYSRAHGSFIVDEASLYDDEDDASTVVSGNVHSLKVQGSTTASHKRSLSNEKLLSTQLSQMSYNNNRVSLDRAILQVQELLQEIAVENEARPIHLPNSKVDSGRQLHVLKLEIKIDGNYSDRSGIQLDKEASAKLFSSQIRLSLKHLASLQKRVDDVSSKVFITGDVNTGKSNFCNSLLRRRVLPEDQLPCTNVFCEILEARDNNNIEEVHALTIEKAKSVKNAIDTYNIRDKSTYEIHPLTDMPDLVQRSDKYVLLKVYIKDDKRPPETSLLRNGTVDISLIDSPGLNMDSVQTAEVMSRQEEIDLVIFVVNAENQLTLSAKDFIALASREKKFMFFVVKKFDRIRDKQRCKDLVLKQIRELSPETHKSSSQFIHFLSNNSGADPFGDPPSDSDDEYEGNPDFDHLENSLRNFVLKKRSTSKLLPAKTYLCKLLSDVGEISRFNMEIYQKEDEKLNEELNELKPEVDKVKAHCNELSETVDKMCEETVSATYEFAKSKIQSSLEIPLNEFPRYQGLSQIHNFIFTTEQFIKDQVTDAIAASETSAKGVTESSVNEINKLGRESLGENFMHNRVFRSNLMFTNRRHHFVKKLSVPLSIKDFFAPSWTGFIDYLSWGLISPSMADSRYSETETNSSNSVTAVLGLGNYSIAQYWTKPSLIFTSKVPTLAVYSFGSVKILRNVVLQGFQFFSWNTIRRVSGSLLVLGGLLCAAYLIHDLPRALPQSLSAKYKTTLQQKEYAHANADRIAREVREVMKIPIREIVKSCELAIDKKQAVKKDLEKKLANNALSTKFFAQLLERASTQRQVVERINLEVD